MSKHKNKEIATSFTTSIFIVIAVTGSMMFFHILDNYTKSMHEILGLVFVGVVFFHVLFNWKSMKTYFSKKVFLGSALVTLMLVLGFIFTSEQEGQNSKRAITGAVFKMPIENSVKILGSDIEVVKTKFDNADIKYSDDSSIFKIAKNNNISPFKVVKVIISH